MTKAFYKNVGRDLFLFWIICTISLCLGLVLNQLRDRPLSLVYQSKEDRLLLTVAKLAASEGNQQAVAGLPASLSLEEFQIFAANKRGIVLDARPEIFHRLGHVPGAISFPRETFEASYAKLKQKLETDKNQALAVYCSGISCEDSLMVQKGLVNLGYTHVSVFRGGWDEWTEAGLPVEKAQ